MAEVELKFDLPPEAHAAFRRLAPIAAAAARTTRLHALYFDTPELELRARGMSLRLRRSGRRWVQTLKAGASGAGGLHAREEWEFDRPRPALDLVLFAATPLGDLPHLAQRLGEIFHVDMRRTTWEIEVSPGNRVEVALDHGKVSRAEQTEPVAEVEIESVAGDPLAVFELAAQLVDHAPLRPSAVTKAQRGYRLARGEASAPVNASRIELSAGQSPGEAARTMVAAALGQLQANEPGVLAARDPEYLHQFRVALRRLRSALRVFRTRIEPEFEAQVRVELRWIAQQTSPARDWDVLANQTLPAILKAHGNLRAARSMRSRVAVRRKAARARLRESLLSPRYARLMLELARWLATAAPEAPGAAEPLAGFAARVVAKGHKRLVAGARQLSALAPAERHQLRLEAKRLRYALEGFEALLRRRRFAAYREALSEIQDDLGRANDAAVAMRLLDEIALPPDLGEFMRGWLAAETHSSIGPLERHEQRLAAAQPPRARD
ncbi:MAG: CHAD domain-containing protein [Usitatibacter sp.]